MCFTWGNTWQQGSGKVQWKPGGSSLQRVPGLFLEWPSKPWSQPRNPVPGLTSSPLTLLFHNRRNPSPVAYFKSSSEAAGSGFWPHSSLSGTVYCSQATQIHSCNKKEPLDKQLLVFPLFRHTSWCGSGITALSGWLRNWKGGEYHFKPELRGPGVRRKQNQHGLNTERKTSNPSMTELESNGHIKKKK